YLGLSFVRSAADVRAARDHIERLGGRVPVIAKIETQAALDHFDEILDAADGIMIARGDLSIETPFARVPIVQKNLIAEANRRGEAGLPAPQRSSLWWPPPHPRGADAGVLAEGTAVDRHPVRAGEVMATIALETERGVLQGPRSSGVSAEPPQSDEEAVIQAACQ